MTAISERKTRLRARTSASVRGRELVVELTPHECIIREAGRRTGYAVPWRAVYETGARLKAIEQRAEKAARKRGM